MSDQLGYTTAINSLVIAKENFKTVVNLSNLLPTGQRIFRAEFKRVESISPKLVASQVAFL